MARLPAVNRESSSAPLGSSPSHPSFGAFAFIWAVTTLVHQLSFTFWAEFWPGWVLVISAVAVIAQPSSLSRFGLMILASLVNLWTKLPFVPNHILFEGMLHVMMLLALAALPECRIACRQHLPRLRWFAVALAVKAGWALSPLSGNELTGSLTTVAIVTAFGFSYRGLNEIATSEAGPNFFHRVAPVLRIALIMMYFWAAIQKMNADYLNPEISCAATLHTEIAHYLPFIPTDHWALVGAIYGSFFFEIAIPLLLMWGRTRRLAFPVAILFHLWLAIHPAAGIYSFSSLILAMLFLFLPETDRRRLITLWEKLCCTAGRGDIPKGRKRAHRAVIYTFFAVLLMQGAMFLTIERSFAVFLQANRIGFAVFMVWGIWLSVCYLLTLWRSKDESPELSDQFQWSPAALGLLLVVANGFSPWIGGKTQTSFSMYSNLRTEGQTNHLFLKRQDWLPFQEELVTITDSQPIDILEPTSKPRGIEQFANPGLTTLTQFELRRQLSRLPESQPIRVEYIDLSDMTRHQVSREDGVVVGEATLFKPIPWWQAKFLWFRRLDRLDGPMPCTH